MSDRESTWQPKYPSTLHQDVVGECRSAWDSGRPYTKIRVLELNVDATDMLTCVGASGFPGPCSNKVEAVQYSSAFGDPLFYCEDHALKQQEIDILHYDSKSRAEKLRPKWTEEDDRRVQKLLSKGKKRDKEEEQEDVE